MEQKEYYKIPAVSASSLKWFEISPWYFRKKLDKELQEPDQKFFERGKQVHMKLLEPELFSQSFCYLEFDKPKSEQQAAFCEDFIASNKKDKATKLIEAYKNNYKVTEKAKDEDVLEKATELHKQLSKYITYLKKRAEVKEVMNKSTWDFMHEAESCVKEHKLANQLMFPEINELQNVVCYNEFEIFWKPNKYNVECKSALDRVIIDHDNKKITLIDLKTTSALSDFSHSLEEFKYYRQLAFYWMALYWYFTNELKLNIEDYSTETYIIGIQTKDLTEVKVFQITPDLINKGLIEIDDLLSKLEWHFETGNWKYSKEYYEGNGVDKL